MSNPIEPISVFQDINIHGYMALVLVCIVVQFGLKKKDFIGTYLPTGSVLLAIASLFALIGYGIQALITWKYADYEQTFSFVNRAFGPFAWAYWFSIFSIYIIPQLLWIPKFRKTIWMAFVVAIITNSSSIVERQLVIFISFKRDFLPSSWAYVPGYSWDQVLKFFIDVFIYSSIIYALNFYINRKLMKENEK